MKSSRRAFLVTGVLGATALAAGGWWHVHAPGRPARQALDAMRDGSTPRVLDPEATAIVAALLPAFLAGALPDAEPARATSLRAAIDAAARAIGGLPPQAQTELAQLFGLLAIAPVRVALGGPWASWRDASTVEVQRMLARWQASRVSLLRSAYDGLHQLLLAAWYGNPLAWQAIGYPGPPRLG
jgi:hypothetical protein